MPCRARQSILWMMVGCIVFTACQRVLPPRLETPSFRLFTNGTEISDEAVKTNFLTRTAPTFSQLEPTISVVGRRITFVANETVTFGADAERFSVVRDGNRYLFYSYPIYHPAAELIRGGYDAELQRVIVKYTSPKIEASISSGVTEYVDKEVRVGYGDAKQIRLSWIQYRWTRSGNLHLGILFNELNEGIASRVRAGDTLAIRMGSVTVPVQ